MADRGGCADFARRAECDEPIGFPAISSIRTAGWISGHTVREDRARSQRDLLGEGVWDELRPLLREVLKAEMQTLCRQLRMDSQREIKAFLNTCSLACWSGTEECLGFEDLPDWDEGVFPGPGTFRGSTTQILPGESEDYDATAQCALMEKSFHEDFDQLPRLHGGTPIPVNRSTRLEGSKANRNNKEIVGSLPGGVPEAWGPMEAGAHTHGDQLAHLASVSDVHVTTGAGGPPRPMSSQCPCMPSDDGASTQISKSRLMGSGIRGYTRRWHEHCEELESRTSTWRDIRLSKFCSGDMTIGEAIKILVRTEYFDYFMGLFLMLNAIAIGVQVDHMARQDHDTPPMHFRIIDLIFLVVFLGELCARLYTFQTKFLKMKGWRWNLFDAVVVVFQILDEAAQILLAGTSVQEVIDNMGVLRILRLGRMLRLIRMVRLIPELKSMVYLIAASMWSFFWTVVLLLLMMYCVAVYYTEVATSIARDRPDDSPLTVELKEHWGSIGSAIFSLFMAISGGDDWVNFSNDFEDGAEWLNKVIFCIYVAFATLVMLNLVTGVFVEGAQRKIQEDKDVDLVIHCRNLFKTSDTDMNGQITLQELKVQLETDAFHEYLAAVDLGKDDALALFKLLDVDRSDSVSIQEFVEGCLRLRGPARSVALSALQYDFREYCIGSDKRLRRLSLGLERILSLLDKKYIDAAKPQLEETLV